MQQKPKQQSAKDSPLERWHKEVLRHLLDLLERNKKTTSSIAQIVDLIFVDQMRSPWPGSFLAPAKRTAFRNWLERNARVLAFSKTDDAIEDFASRVSSRLLRELSASQISLTLVDQESEKKAQIEYMIRQEVRNGAQAEDTVDRSVQRYLKQNARSKLHQTEIKAAQNNPIRDLLGLPRIGRALLPREDIRVHLANFLAKANMSIELLAAASEPQTLLGEFAKQCSFAGFVDKDHRIMLLHVKSPVVAQELTFQKLALLKRIRKTPQMAKVLDVQFRVKQR